MGSLLGFHEELVNIYLQTKEENIGCQLHKGQTIIPYSLCIPVVSSRASSQPNKPERNITRA